MARARNIKPSIIRNEDLADLDPIYRLGFVFSWMVADVNGVIEFRPKRLKADLFPYDEVDIEDFVLQMAIKKFLILFVVSGRRYLKIVNFAKHQNPHKQERAAGSGLPDLSDPKAVRFQTVEELRKYFGSSSEELAMIPDPPILIPESPLPELGDGAAAVYSTLKAADAEGRNCERASRPISMIPATEASAKLDLWLEEVAARIGAKSSATMANPKSWERMCMNAISEGRELRDVLEVIEQEKERTRGQSQYFSADGILKILQTRDAKTKISKFIH